MGKVRKNAGGSIGIEGSGNHPVRGAGHHHGIRHQALSATTSEISLPLILW